MTLTARELAVLRTPLGPRYDDRLERFVAKLRGFGIQGRGPVSDGRGIEMGSVIPDSVAHQYRFEYESDTTVAVDSVGDADMELTNNPTYTNNSIDGSHALFLDASNDEWGEAAIGFSSEWTIETRMKIPSGGEIFGTHNDPDSNQFSIFRNSGALSVDQPNDTSISGGTIPTAEYIDIAVSWNGSTSNIRGYINGEKVFDGGKSGWDGTHDKFRIPNREGPSTTDITHDDIRIHFKQLADGDIPTYD
jgi:hypothetical protein